MTVGRKPKPTAIKELAGNPGKRPLNDREPQAPVKEPSCPRHVVGEARKEWHRVVGELVAMGVVTEVDRAALAAYAVAYGRWVEAEKMVTEKGMIIRTTNDNIIQNPFLSVANKAYDQMSRMAAEFGMTPSSRSRITVARTDIPTIADMLFDTALDGE